jgi:acyl-CoA thioester hydrolase
MNPFVWKVRVYMEDTDAGGVVHHSMHVCFFERARTEWLRGMGVQQGKLAEEDSFGFAIRHMEIDYSKAVRLDDELDITVHVTGISGTRVMFSQVMTRCSDQQRVASANLTAVCVKTDSFKPTRLPEWIRAEISTKRT